MILNNIISKIKESNSIGIFSHVAADGDALGSCFALAIVLKKLGKNVTVFLEEDIPEVYDFLPGKEFSKVYNGESISLDIAISLDTGGLNRLGKREEVFKSVETTINIDHHHINTQFAVYNYVNAFSAATGEIIYKIIKLMGENLDKDIATCLYVAILTDTGGFKYSNTTSITHQIVADLINAGLTVSEISEKIYDNISIEKLKISSFVVDNIKFYYENKVCVGFIDYKTFVRFNAKTEDSDGVIDLIRKIKGVEIAIFIKETEDGKSKISLRANKDYDVSIIAQKFGGGGHKKASGILMDTNLDQAENMVLDSIKKEFF